MTYEQKAEALAVGLLGRPMNSPSTLALITTALREAGNAKLEEAALFFEEKMPCMATPQSVAMFVRTFQDDAAPHSEAKRKADAYDACVEVARRRISQITPDLDREIPALCSISNEIWETHKAKAPIMALDMLEHAKRKKAEILGRSKGLEEAAALAEDGVWVDVIGLVSEPSTKVWHGKAGTDLAASIRSLIEED